MISSTFKAGLFIAVLSLTVFAQQPEKKTSTSTISGKVTLKGNAAARVAVVARLTQARQHAQFFAETDTEGNYRIVNVSPGTYEVAPSAPQHALTGVQIKTLMVDGNENYDGIDFTLIPGGVITGRVTDGEGKPLIEQEIALTGPEDSPLQATRIDFVNTMTDDRGIYRIFGLVPGKYSIAAGADEDRFFLGGYTQRGTAYKRTFHPSTTDAAKATLVEVTEGSEAKNVDITLRRRLVGYTVTGRVVDAAGKGQRNIRYSLTKYVENGSSSNGGMLTDALGGFRFENLPPGNYGLALSHSVDTDAYAEPVPFEVIDRDVENLVLKLAEGSSITGSIVFEGVDEKIARTKFRGITVVSYMDGNRSVPDTNVYSAMMTDDGSFKLTGLGSGVVQFSLSSSGDSEPNFQLVRVERGGVVINGIEIRQGEKISGVRLVVRMPTGGIRGVVNIQNGDQETHVLVFATRVGESSGSTTRIDARGRFSFGGLAAGIYDVTLMPSGKRLRRPPPKQQVIVTDGQVTEVTLTLDAKKLQP